MIVRDLKITKMVPNKKLFIEKNSIAKFFRYDKRPMYNEDFSRTEILLSQVSKRDYSRWLQISAKNDVWTTPAIITKILSFLSLTDLLTVRRVNTQICDCADVLISRLKPAAVRNISIRNLCGLEKLENAVKFTDEHKFTVFGDGQQSNATLYSMTQNQTLGISSMEETQRATALEISIIDFEKPLNYEKKLEEAFLILWSIPAVTSA